MRVAALLSPTMIDSPANPTVKLLRSLESPKQIREHGLFRVEGVRAVQDALDAGYWPRICLYNSELLVRTERGRALLKRLQSPKAASLGKSNPQEAGERAHEAATSTQHPQGVVAAFSLLDWPTPARNESTNPLALICDQIQDPGNLGTILRSAEAAGARGVWLSPRCVDHYNPKVVRAAMGAHFRLPVYDERDWSSIESDLESIGISNGRLFGTEGAAALIYDLVDWTQPSALIISNEAHGLSGEARALLEKGGETVSVPMLGGTESLNASIAAAVILFEAARQRRNSDNVPSSELRVSSY
jgi:TrmH family RNA methyltransferase